MTKIERETLTKNATNWQHHAAADSRIAAQTARCAIDRIEWQLSASDCAYYAQLCLVRLVYGMTRAAAIDYLASH